MDKNQDLRQLIIDVLAAEGRADGDVTARTALASGGLELTSLELVRLLVGLEERLGIELNDAAIMNGHFDTVDDIIALVTQSA